MLWKGVGGGGWEDLGVVVDDDVGVG